MKVLQEMLLGHVWFAPWHGSRFQRGRSDPIKRFALLRGSGMLSRVGSEQPLFVHVYIQPFT